jgi:RNA polymerase sigma-70 factor (ECF subfamily)
MTDRSADLLRRTYLRGYADLKVRLTKRLGSAELASDALQDAWLRLESVTSVGSVERPWPYILQIAYNMALKRLHREREMVTLDDARAALSLVDDGPSATQITEARSELALLRLVVQELTPRRREILFASRLDGTSLRELADRYAISQRLVERELRHAVLYCAKRLGRGPRSREGSSEESSE